MATETKTLESKLDALAFRLDGLGKQPAVDTGAITNTHPPAVRKGESALTSRPASFTKLLGMVAGHLNRDNCRVEYDAVVGFRKGLTDTNSLLVGIGDNTALYPLGTELLPSEAMGHEGTQTIMKSFGISGRRQDVDIDEIRWMARNKSFSPDVRKTALSYLDDSIGGSLVAPPVMGDLIPLMRNASAVDRAGATQVSLPANGKWVAPRVTSPTTGYIVGENTAITESQIGTGEATMMAKKIGVLVRVPNELFKFATGATDAMLQGDIAKTLGLNFDYLCLYGTGSGGQPKGLVQYTGTNEMIDYAGLTPAPKGVDTNGNTLRPEDGFRMAARVAARNFDVGSLKWVMTPILSGSIQSYRGDAVSAADQAGLFVQSLTRALAAGAGDSWCNRQIVESSQVKSTYTKGGSGATLTELFGGVWPEFIQGRYGAIELAVNTMGEATFAADQTLIRGILHGDCVPRYPGAFVRYKELLNS
jgi:HK97 family phage major capsid protein